MTACSNVLLSSPVLMVVTSRNHPGKFWASWPRHVRREIERLSRPQTAALLEILLGSEPQLEELKALLSGNSQGNPFFVEECVKVLDESGKLRGSPGDYRLEAPVSALEIPATVHGVLAARIDSLSSPDKNILLSASIIGQRVDVTLLREMEGLTREETLARLSRLQQAGFLDRTPAFPLQGTQPDFTHAGNPGYRGALQSAGQAYRGRE